MKISSFLLRAAVSAGWATVASAATAPQILSAGSAVNIARAADGSLFRFWASGGFTWSQQSYDDGTSWSPAVKLYAAPSSSNPTPLVDAQGELHFVQLKARDETNGATKNPNVNYFLDIYANSSSNQRTTWTTPAPAFLGYSSSIMQAIQTQSGRIVVPMGSWIPNSTSTSTNGHTFTTDIYSDDNGATWSQSPSALYAITPSDWNGSDDGVCEPAITQLNDGRLYMLMRNQTGKLLQSYSSDNGTTWADPTPSNFYTTSGPPCMLRLQDGRLMLIWNNGTMPQRYNSAIWYAGRDELTAAISSDDGKTWSGYREIYLDPARNQNPPTGDSGTAYPFAAQGRDGKVVIVTGQGAAHTMLRIDPNWLTQTTQSEDFNSANALDDWSIFKPYGAVVSTKRNRVAGPELINDPDSAVANPVLHIRRPDTNDADGAMWNFPMAKKGQTLMRFQIEPGFRGGAIAFDDRFFNPTDPQGDTSAIFSLPLASNGLLPGGTALQTGQWYNLQLNWDLATHSAAVLLNGQQVTTLNQLNQALPGPSYLRLRSTASAVDTAGFLVDDISQTGLPTGHVHESTRLSATDSATMLAPAAGWTSIRFDDYVPNPNKSGTIATFNGTFTGFTSPQTSAAPIGMTVSSSTNNVTFSDLTLSRVTSDIVGPANGGTMTVTFVDPSDITRPATVSGVAWRIGSTIANNVNVKLYDMNGVEMPDYLFQSLDASSNGTSVGFQALSDLVSASVIHRIVFTGVGSDSWVIGSFAQSTALADFAFSGFTPATQSPGDANYDTSVDSMDFDILASHFGASGATWAMGDFNGDGIVNALDFNALASNYGSNFGTTAAAPLGLVAPGPAGTCVLAFSALMLGGRRRNRT